MTTSLTKGLISSVHCWAWGLSMDRQHLLSSPNFIQICVIGQLTFNFKMIWLSICELILATNECIVSFLSMYLWQVEFYLVVNYEILFDCKLFLMMLKLCDLFGCNVSFHVDLYAIMSNFEFWTKPTAGRTKCGGRRGASTIFARMRPDNAPSHNSNGQKADQICVHLGECVEVA